MIILFFNRMQHIIRVTHWQGHIFTQTYTVQKKKGSWVWASNSKPCDHLYTRDRQDGNLLLVTGQMSNV